MMPQALQLQNRTWICSAAASSYELWPRPTEHDKVIVLTVAGKMDQLQEMKLVAAVEVLCESRRLRSPRHNVGPLSGARQEMDRYLPVAAVVAVVLMCCSGICRGERLGARECEDLGFTGLALCSDCNALSEFVKDQELVDDCRKCCTEDSDDSISKLTFSGAIIEVCMRKLVFYPEIVGFLEEDKDDFPYVEARYSYGSPPKLIMLDDKGEHKETIRIDNWKREHIRQFLKEKVKPVKSDS